MDDTRYNDFAEAEKIGVDAIRETYEDTFFDWKPDYDDLTTLAMILESRSVQLGKYAKLYSELQNELEDYIYNTCTDEELTRHIERMKKYEESIT